MKKKLLSWLLVVALVITMVPGSAFASSSGYVGTGAQPETTATKQAPSVETEETATVGGYTITVPTGVTKPNTSGTTVVTEIDANTTEWGELGKESWYVVKGAAPVIITQRINVNGNVNLILADGANLDAQQGITVENNDNNTSLSIWSQSIGENIGKLTAKGAENCAGIGGVNKYVASNITINGGIITATGGNNGAGIGNGQSGGANSSITINGGKIIAKGGSRRAGIGGAKNSCIIINGGSITAIGGEYGAGIGGGETGSVANITISGGNVNATGGNNGAGIGVGDAGSGGNITISGGNVNATGGNNGAGIGGKINGGYGSFTTTSSGNAVIFASSIQDKTKQAEWSGVIFESNKGNVYGTPTINQNMTIPTEGTLNIGDGVILTNNGTIINNGTIDNWGTISGTGTIEGNGKLFNSRKNVSYIDPAAPNESKSVEGAMLITSNTTELTGGNGAENAKWYMVDGEVNVPNRIIVTGHVNLILADNAHLNAQQGITVLHDNNNNNLNQSNLTIWAQSANKKNMGKLTATGGNDVAGIGGDKGLNAGFITIKGGIVTATGGNGAAGIGGCNGGDSGTKGNVYGITIEGGIVTATGGNNGAGIGGGNRGTCGSIIIESGIVTATGGSGNVGNSSAKGIGSGANQNPSSFETTSNGNAVIIASSIDVTLENGKEKWSGIISEDSGKTTTIYGSQTLKSDYTVEKDKTLIVNGTLNISHGVNFSNNGTLINNGVINGVDTIGGNGEFYKEKIPTVDNIIVPDSVNDSMVYNGQVYATKDEIKLYVKEFNQNWAFKGWTSTLTKGQETVTEIKDAGEYTITFSKGNNEPVSKKFTVKSAVIENNIKNVELVYNGSDQIVNGTGLTAVNDQPITIKYGNTEGNYTLDELKVNEAGPAKTYYYKATAPNHAEKLGSFTVEVKQSASEIKTENLKAYKGERTEATTTFTYGDTITVKAKPTATGKVPVSANSRGVSMFKRLSTPTTGQMALFVNGVQVSEAVYVSPDGYYSMILNTTDEEVNKHLKPGSTIEVTAKFVGNTNMDDTTGVIALTVNKADASVNTAPTANDLTYTGKAQSLVVAGTPSGGTMQYKLGETGKWQTKVPQAIDAGTYDIYYKVVGDANHNDSAEVKLDTITIAHKKVTPKIEVAQGTFAYNGKAQEPKVTVKDVDVVIPETEYKVTYSNNTNVGKQATVTVNDNNLSGNYELTENSVTFEIIKSASQLKEITILGTISYGDTFKVTFTPALLEEQNLLQRLLTATPAGNTAELYYGNTKLATAENVTEGNLATFTVDTTNKDIAATEFDGKKHDFKVVWGGDSNLNPSEGTVQATLQKCPLTATVKAGAKKTYDGNNEFADVELLLNNVKGEDTVTATANGTVDTKNQGTQAVTVTNVTLAGDNKDYYSLTNDKVSGNFTIEQLEAQLEWTNTSIPFDGTEKIPTATVKNKIDGDTVNVTVTGGKVNVGTGYTAEATKLSNDNYKLPTAATQQFEITKVAPKCNAPVVKTNLTYDGTAQDLVTAGTTKDGEIQYKLGAEDQWQTEVPKATDKGKYTVYYKVKGDANHNDSEEKSLDVNINAAPLTITAEDKTVAYGAEAPAYTAQYDGFVNNETEDVLDGTLDFKCAYTNQSPAGKPIDIIPSGRTSTNYDISYVNGTLTVDKADAVVTEPRAKDLTYNGQGQALVTVGTVPTGAEIQYSLEKEGAYSTTVPTGIDAKEYTVWYKVVGGDNYNDQIAKSVKVIIEQKDITDQTIKLDGQLVYNGALQTQKIEPIVIDGLKATYDISGNTAINAGINYELTVIGTGNYKGTVKKAFIVAKAEVTADMFQATDFKFTYDGNEHQPTVTVKPELNGIGEVAVTTKATKVADSTQAIVFEVAEGNNYKAGNLTIESPFTIEQKVATLEWSNLSFKYDGQKHKPTATVSNLEGQDQCDVTVTGEESQAGTTYTAAATVLSNPNYKLPTEVTKTFEITKADVNSAMFNVADTKITYDGNEHKPTVTVKPEYKGVGAVEVTTKATNVADSTEKIEFTVAEGDNYNAGKLTIASPFTIEQKILTIDVKVDDKYWDGKKNAKIASAKLQGVVGTEDVKLVIGTAEFEKADIAKDISVTLTGFKLEGKDIANYSLVVPTDVKASINNKPAPPTPEPEKPVVPEVKPDIEKPILPVEPPKEGANIGIDKEQQAETDQTIKDIVNDIVKPADPEQKPDPEKPQIPQTEAEKETAVTEQKIAEAAKDKDTTIKVNVETEKVDEAKASVEVKKEIDQIKETMKESFEAAGTKMLQLVNIDVTAQAVDKAGKTTELGKLRNLGKSLTFTIQLPLDVTGNNYAVIRVHDGKAEIIASKYDPITKKITFDTDKFSTYAVVEYDKAITPEPPVDPEKPEVTKPGIVQNIDIDTDNGLFKVTFDKLDNATNYRVYVTKAGENNWRWYNAKNGSALVKQLYKKPIVKNGKYQVKVVAYNETVKGDASDIQTIYANRIGTKSAKMYAPKFSSITFAKNRANTTTAKVIAKKVYVKNTPKNLQYKVSYRLKGTKTWKSAGYSAKNVKYVKGLKKGKVYTFAVRYRYQSAVDGKTIVYSNVTYKSARVK